MDPEILRSSFAVVERRAEFAVKYFYSHLFRHNPDVRGLFPLDFPEDMERQRDRLFAALTYVMERLEDPTLPGYLRELGRDHRKYLAEPEHYAAVGASLIAAFAAVAGSAWSAEAEKAWAEAYGAITNVMLQGAWEAQHEGEPPWWDAEVVSRTRHGDDLVVLTLRPHQRLRYSPGQYVSVSVPICRASGARTRSATRPAPTTPSTCTSAAWRTGCCPPPWSARPGRAMSCGSAHPAAP